MTKVKVDVQLVVTGGMGDGKSQVTSRILKAIQSDKGLQSICKIHPARSFEAIRCEHTGLSFEGELTECATEFEQGKEVRHGIFAFQFPNGTNLYAWKPDGIDMFKGASYAVDVAMLEQKEYNEANDPYAHKEPEPSLLSKVLHRDEDQQITEYKPMNLYVNINGAVRASSKYGFDYVITILAATPANPVGEGQPEASAPDNVGSGATGGYVDRCLFIVGDHVSEQTRPAPTAPKPNAHIGCPPALNTLSNFPPDIQAKFHHNDSTGHSTYPSGLVAGNKVQVIYDTGDIGVGLASDFQWKKGNVVDIVYYRRSS